MEAGRDPPAVAAACPHNCIRGAFVQTIMTAAMFPEHGATAPNTLSYAEFGENFIRQVLHLDRVLESIDRLLGESFELGPIGAGPGRKLARLTAHGRYRPTYGEALPGPDVGYLVNLPVDVDFELAIPLDRHRFQAQVVVPLRITLRLVEPMTIVWDIEPPAAEAVQLTLTNEARRSAMLQKLAGIEDELRAFLTRFVDRELAKPYVQKARHIPVVTLIDNAWEPLARQFLPSSPEDRLVTDV
ncbi:MAG: hypothetical protein EOO74_09955 [Myxococcales bacterium]|nr:MAG: hypothetical protein EOO74_09955 [Myxococcales bacterium]